MVHMVSEEAQLLQTQQLLDVKQIAGGNIVRCRPVFSTDSSTLFLARGCVVEAYNVKTGSHIQDYTGLESPAIGVQLHPSDDQLLVACSEQGELISWRLNTQTPESMVKLDMPTSLGTACKFRGFLLILTTKIDGSEKCDVFATISDDPTQKPWPVTFCSASGNVRKTDLDFSVDNHPNSFSFGGKVGHRFLATVSDNRLTLAYTSALLEPVVHCVGKPQTFTCVTCHPNMDILATGLSTGMVIVWRNYLGEKEVRSTFHWHQLPVQDVVFSEEASFFYSGAGECVLVKWDLEDKASRQYMPRMSAPIRHLAVSPGNGFVAATTVDNAVSIANSQLVLSSTVQSLTWGDPTGIAAPPLAAGVRVNPRDGALVLNGRVGHLQFFDPVKRALDYNLDITCMNYITQERDRLIVNTSVTALAISADGNAMATVEERDDGETLPESRIKFWMYNEAARGFALNTTVEQPHHGSTVAVEFQPSEAGAEPQAATLGTDRKFRVWAFVPARAPGQGSWECKSVGFYKSLQPGALSFSQDGSLLAVAFASSLTVWTPVTCETKCSLTHPTTRSTIRHVEFGRKEACHLVVAASDSCLCVWNLLSLSMAWTVDVNVSVLVADPESSVMAVFTQQNDLFVFAPASCQPLYKHNNVSPFGAEVFCAAFRPRRGGEKPTAGWQAHSQLFFFSENQNVMGLEDPSTERDDEGLEAMQPPSKPRLTPFAALMAQHLSSSVNKLVPLAHTQRGNPGVQAVTEFLAAPCHTMPPLSLLCGEFLRSFTSSSECYMNDESSQQQSKMDVDDDNVKIEKLGKKLKETKVSNPAVLDEQLELILEEDLGWVDTYGIIK